MRHMVSFCVFLVSWGTLKCPGVFSGLAIHTETRLSQCILKLNITCLILNYLMRFNENKHSN